VSAVLSSSADISRNDFIVKPLFVWPDTVERGTSSSAACFRADLQGDCSKEAATAAQVTVRDIGRLLRREVFTFPYENALISMIKERLCAEVA
jgi:hypothetical protein